MRDRAVSNTLGFVLIFSIVLFSLALVSTAGMAGLENTRDATMANNAEQSFLDLARAIQDVHRGDEPRRTASMRLGRGQLRPGDETTINVTLEGDPVVNATLQPIVYQLDDTRIVYEGTAIFRQDGDATAVVSEPDWLLENDQRFIVPVVATEADTDASVAGSSAQVYIRQDGRETNFTTLESGVLGSGSDEIVVEIGTTPEREEAWQRALEAVSDCGTIGPGEVRCDISQNTPAVVREVGVRYSLEV